MAKKVWVVRYYRPGKFDKVLEWNTYPTKEMAEKAYEKAKKVKDATDLKLEETECCSL